MNQWKVTRILAHGLVIALITALPVSAMLLMAAEDDAGKAAYDKSCSKCHGPDAKADTKMGKMIKTPDLTDKANWKQGTSQEEVEKVIREGLGKMPKFAGKMSDAEVSAAAAYTIKLSGVNE